jgi:preprotein translocase subunit SecG
MELLTKFIIVFHILLALAICVFVLLQHGKGADLGAAFGSGASGSLFGATGSANFLSRTTAVLVTLFFVTSIALTYISVESSKPAPEDGVMSGHQPVTAPATPSNVPEDVPAPMPTAPAANTPADVPAGAAVQTPAEENKAQKPAEKTVPKS